MKGASATAVRLKLSAPARQAPGAAGPVSARERDAQRLILELDLTDLVRALIDAARSVPADTASDWIEAKTFQFGRRLFNRLAKVGAFPVTSMGQRKIARKCDIDAYFVGQLSSLAPRDASPALIGPVRRAATNGRLARDTRANTVDEQPSNTQRLQGRTHAETKNRNGSVPKR